MSAQDLLHPKQFGHMEGTTSTTMSTRPGAKYARRGNETLDQYVPKQSERNLAGKLGNEPLDNEYRAAH